MNFNNILIGITLLISLITLYTIYNVNNNMDKLLLDDDSDDLDGNKQRLSIIKYAKENNLKLNSFAQSIANLLSGMMKYNTQKLGKDQAQIMTDINELRGDLKAQRGLLMHILSQNSKISDAVIGVPVANSTRALARPRDRGN